MDSRRTVQLLEAALEHHRAGNLPQAEVMYRHVLENEPRNADALHLLGALAADAGHAEAGANLIRQAIAIVPNVGEFHRHLGEALTKAGRPSAEAAAAFATAAKLDPR